MTLQSYLCFNPRICEFFTLHGIKDMIYVTKVVDFEVGRLSEFSGGLVQSNLNFHYLFFQSTYTLPTSYSVCPKEAVLYGMH